MFELESGIEDEDGIELVTYTTNYVDHDFDFSVTTTEFHNRDTVEVSGGDETESLDLCLAAEDGYAEDRLSLDSNTVAVDWDREGGNIVVFDNSSMHQQGYAKGYTMTLNNKLKSVSSFTSYIDLEAEDPAQEGMDLSNELHEGELFISKADRVCSYSTVSGLTSGMSGTLFVTTLKLSLKLHIEDELNSRQNKILGPWDIPLTSIYAVYEISGDGGDKKKRLTLGSNVTSKVDGIFIICKNYRFYRFSFKFAKIDQGRNIVNALLHHIRPKKANLLFAFEQRLYTHLEEGNRKISSWKEIKKKSHAKNVRLSVANETWQISNSLPQEFIVPAHITDEKLGGMSGLFLGNRPPVWVWGTPEGGALYIQPVLNVLPSTQIDQLRQDYYVGGTGKKLTEILLERKLPSQAFLEDAYSSMLELHCIESEKEAEKIDTDYFSRLELSGWLSTISTILRLGCEICEMMWRGECVVLVEDEGRGTSILIASIVEILLEEEHRTRQGFEILVQQNWVSLGFPFSTNHQLCSPRAQNSIVPIFLMFLDSVYQLSQQFPSHFEFRPQYMVDLWDTALVPMFDTFLFDSEHDRSMARRNPETPLNPSSAWNWGLQFSQEYIKNWENPLFGIPRRPDRNNLHDPSHLSMIMDKQIFPGVPESKKYLPVNHHVSCLQVWVSFYHRSVPFFQIPVKPGEELLRLQRESKQSIDEIYKTTVRGKAMNNATRLNNH